MTFPVDPTSPPQRTSQQPLVRLLEQFTGCVLGIVIVAVGWILVAASEGGDRSAARETAEVAVVLVLLTGALGLVTLGALLHTRARK